MQLSGYVLLGLFTVMVIAYIVFPVFAKPKPVARRERRRSCLSNIRRISTAFLIYSYEHDRLPQAGAWMDSLNPYVSGTKKFDCPDLPADNPYSYGYAMRSRLSGATIDSIRNPEKEALDFDSWPLGRNAHTDSVLIPGFTRHGGQNIGYADGHAQLVPSTK